MKWIILLFMSTSLHAQVLPFTNTLNKGGSEFGFYFNYFTTAKRIDSEGEVITLEDGESYQELRSTFVGRYGLVDNLEISFGLEGKTVQTTSIFEDEEVSFSGTNGTFAFLGLEYSFERRMALNIR